MPLAVVAWAARRPRHACRHALALPPLRDDRRRRSLDIRRGRRRFVVAEFVGGVAWAVDPGACRLPGAGRDGLEVFQFATMLIVVSVITSLASTVPAAAVAGTVPMTLTLVALYVSRGDFLFVALSVDGARRRSSSS